MSRMINNLNNAQRTSNNKYSMALENAQAEDLRGQQEFSGLVQEPKDTFPASTSYDSPAEAATGATFSIKNSLGVAMLVLGVLLALTLSVKAFLAVSGDKSQTVKLAQIVAKQNRDIENLESTITTLQAERKAELEKLTKNLKSLEKKVAENGKDFSEMAVDTSMTRSILDAIKTTQKQIMSKLGDVNKDIELIKTRP